MQTKKRQMHRQKRGVDKVNINGSLDRKNIQSTRQTDRQTDRRKVEGEKNKRGSLDG